MKRKGRKRVAAPRRKAAAATPALPPFLDSEQTRFLLDRVRRAARTPEELDTFRGLVRRAYDEALELEILYRDLPGVLAGDRDSERNFRRVLERAAGRMPGPGSRGTPPRRRFSFVAGLGTHPALPCAPEFFIGPDRILNLVCGIERLAAGDAERAAVYRGTLRGLWQNTKALDDMLKTASEEDFSGGRDRFGEHMRVLARDARGGAAGGPGGTPRGRPPDDAWPPPDVPGTEWPPEPDRPPGLGDDFCEQAGDLCRELIAEGLMGAPLPTSVWADTITSVDPAECDGDFARVRIHGSGFGSAQPPNVVVLVDFEVAEVESWSDTEIVIRIPADMPSGCIGFRDEVIEAQRHAMQGQVQEAWEKLNQGLRCLEGAGIPPDRLPYSSSRAPCTAFNTFAGTLPEIRYFRINGGTDVSVARHGPRRLTWRVDNAQTIRIRRVVPGPGLDLLNPPGNSYDLGAASPAMPQREEYEMVAANGCGEARARVALQVRQEANLRIVGIEVVQVIQRPASDVRLVAHKNTVVRVYLDPGNPRGLDDVTGRVTIRRGGAAPGDPPVGVARPFNRIGMGPEGFMNLRPGPSDRGDLEQSLNFLLPFRVLDGMLELHVEAYENGRRGDAAWGVHAEQSLVVHFQARRGHRIVQLRVRDNHLGLAPPTLAAFDTTLRGMVRRVPMPEEAFEVFLVNGDPNFAFDTDHDFTAAGTASEATEPWADLLDDLADFASDFPDIGQVWVALLTDDPRYNKIGGASPGDGSPCLAGKTNPDALILTHEYLHTQGIQHAQCPGDPGRDPIDPRLTAAATEEPGMDTSKPALVAAGTRELMCWFHRTGAPAWTTIVLWDVLFDLWS
jgi:hypothetical protein